MLPNTCSRLHLPPPACARDLACWWRLLEARPPLLALRRTRREPAMPPPLPGWSGACRSASKAGGEGMASDGLCLEAAPDGLDGGLTLQTVGRGMPRPPSHEKLSRQCGAQDDVDRLPTSKEDDE